MVLIMQKLEQETCAISDEELRPYFSVNAVMDGFELAKEPWYFNQPSL